MTRYYAYEQDGIEKEVLISVEVARLLRRRNDADFQDMFSSSIRSYSEGTMSVAFDSEGKDDIYIEAFAGKIFVVMDDQYEREALYEHFAELSQLEMLEDEACFTELYEKALSIAKEAHKNQTDKAGKPYIEHPLYVSGLVEGNAEKITALLHDVVEDTPYTVEDIRESFPDIIADAVDAISRREDELYADYIVRLRENPIARKVKIADMKHNLDISRISEPTDRDRRRVERYAQYLEILSTDYYYEDLALEESDPELRMIDYQIDGYEFHRAMRFIRNADKDRIIKAMEVNNILRDFGASMRVQLTALLYCCIEMELLSAVGIANNFGEKVWDTYLHMPWNYNIPIEDRTEIVEEFLDVADEDQKLIMLAIAITELREYEYLAYKNGQDGVFRSEEEKLRYEEYFSVLTDGFDEYEEDENMRPYYWTLQNLFKDVFVSYHVNKDRTVIYQGCDLYCWMWDHEDGDSWEMCEVRDFPEDAFDRISREEAEMLEESWEW